MREIVETALRLRQRRALILPIPYTLAAFAVGAAERFRLPLSFNSGSLRAMKLNRKRLHESNLRSLLGDETDLETAIARSLA